MALPVLDGNQTATTLSSVVTGGEHIVAHSVVSLGANAIANITSAVSGSVVSISNFPPTQTIAGTVTANANNFGFEPSEDLSVFGKKGIVVGYEDDSSGEYRRVRDNQPLPVTINPSGAIPAISGTVTAKIDGIDPTVIGNGGSIIQSIPGPDVNSIRTVLWSVDTNGDIGAEVGPSNPLPISGTVTVGNSVTIGSVPNGSLTTRFGTPTTANIAFATSAVTNANRKYLLIQNVTTGSNVITVGIGFTPTTTQGIQLTAGAGITFESSYIPTGQIFVLSSVTASNFTVLEA